MIMSLYALLPILRKVAHDDKLLKYAIVLWGAYIIGNFIIFKNVPQIKPLFVLNTIIAHSGFFLMGYYLSKTSFSKKQQGWIYSLGILCYMAGSAIVVGVSLWKGKPVAEPLNRFRPYVIMSAVALFVCMKEKVTTLNPKANWLIEHVRKDLFGVYLIHFFWLYAINWSRIENFCDPAISLLVIGILVFIISLLSIKLIRLVPILRKVVE